MLNIYQRKQKKNKNMYSPPYVHEHDDKTKIKYTNVNNICNKYPHLFQGFFTNTNTNIMLYIIYICRCKKVYILYMYIKDRTKIN